MSEKGDRQPAGARSSHRTWQSSPMVCPNLDAEWVKACSVLGWGRKGGREERRSGCERQVTADI